MANAVLAIALIVYVSELVFWLILFCIERPDKEKPPRQTGLWLLFIVFWPITVPAGLIYLGWRSVKDPRP